MERFQLNVYAKRSPKGKIIKKKFYESPMAARLSKEAQKADYWEIFDTIERRIIEMKKE